MYFRHPLDKTSERSTEDIIMSSHSTSAVIIITVSCEQLALTVKILHSSARRVRVLNIIL
jgi:hypothetical protein